MAHKCKDILFLPGLLCSGSILYAHTINAFTKLGYRCHIPHKFHTYNSISAVTQYILNDVVNGVDKFSVIGLSYGGYLAFDLLRTVDSTRIHKLILCSTQPTPDTERITANRLKEIELAKHHGMHAVVDSSKQRMCDARSYEKYPDLLEKLYAMADIVGVDGFENQQTAIIHRIDSRPHLNTIKCPVLVVCGENDNLIPNKQSTDLVRTLREIVDPDLKQITTVGSSYSIAHRRIQSVMIPQVGHIVTLEAPEVSTEIFVDFIDH